MTNVKRISSLRESSPSTRTRRVSRMAVTPTVSKPWDTHARFRAEGQRRSRVGEGGGDAHRCASQALTEALPASSPYHHLFLMIFFHSNASPSKVSCLGCWSVSGREAKWTFFFSPLFHVTCPHMVVLYDPVLPPEIMSPPGRPVVFISPCWLLSAWEDTDLRARSSLSWPTRNSHCGCPSSLSLCRAPPAPPIGHPGDRWWWVWDKNIQ